MNAEPFESVPSQRRVVRACSSSNLQIEKLAEGTFSFLQSVNREEYSSKVIQWSSSEVRVSR